MSSSRSDPAKLAETIGRPSIIVVVVVPVLFVVFGVDLPIGAAVGLQPPFVLLLGLLAAASGSSIYLVERLLRRKRSAGVAAQVREVVLLLLANALIVWATLRVPFPRIIRSAELWSAAASAALVWILVGLLQRTMAKREFFVTAVERAAGARQGDRAAEGVVLTAARDLSVEAGESAGSLRRSRHWMAFFIVWQIALLVVDAWVLGHSPVAQRIGSCLSAAAALYGLILLGRMREDQRFLAEGLLPTAGGRAVEGMLSGALYAAAVAASLFVALRPALVPESVLAACAAWVAALLSGIRIPEPGPLAPPPAPPRLPPPSRMYSGELLNRAPPHASELVGTILTYLGWLLVAMVGLAFLWLLVSPLFRLRLRRGGTRAALMEMLRRMGSSLALPFHRLARSLRILLGRRRTSEPYGGSPTVLFQGGGGRGGARRRRPAFLRTIFGGRERRFGRAFFRLVSWGEQHGVAFSLSIAPKEYVGRLSAAVPELAVELAEIAELYEEHLYAPAPLPPARLERYFVAIKGVTRGERI